MEIKTNIHRRDAESAERDGFSFAAERPRLRERDASNSKGKAIALWRLNTIFSDLP